MRFKALLIFTSAFSVFLMLSSVPANATTPQEDMDRRTLMSAATQAATQARNNHKTPMEIQQAALQAIQELYTPTTFTDDQKMDIADAAKRLVVNGATPVQTQQAVEQAGAGNVSSIAEGASRGGVAPPAPSPNATACESGLSGIGCTITRLINGFILIILGSVVRFFGTILLFLIDILLGFASYNGFGTALPVVKGWIIVRDVANMFFIVILVVSAISTIIDYNDGYHYKKVLPRLLLMAILINFSRTLIMLLVDFSQVVMLTFVNGFKAAAAGNFVNALGLSNLLNISNSQGINLGAGSVPNGISFADVFVSYLLAIMMVCISIGVVTIIVAYLIFRIIGIWMLLIFAPLAFLLTALPEPLKKKISFGDDYWKKLGTLLTGGPIMAFFLWLTLAVVQSSTSSLPTAGSVDQAAGPGVGGGTAAFLTNIGTAPEIATFIVAITMMLMGLDQATSIAKDVGSSALTDFAKKASDKARGAAKWIGMAPIRRGKRALQAVDDRYKVLETGSRLGLRGVSKVPNALKGLVPTAAVGALGAGITMSKKRQEADAKNTAKLAEGLSAEDQRLVAGTVSTSDGLLSGSSAGERLGRADLLAGTASVESRTKQTKKRSGEIKNELTEERARGLNTMSDEDIKRTADSRAMDEIDTRSAEALKEARSLYDKAGNKDKISEVDKILEKDPQLETDKTKFDSLMTTIKNDPEKIKALSPGALSSGKVLMGLLPTGSIKKDATGNVTGIDESQFQSFLESEGVKGNKHITGNLSTLKSTIGGKRSGISEAELVQATVQRDKYGTNGMYSTVAGQGRITNDYQETAMSRLNAMAPEFQSGALPTDGEFAIIDAVRRSIPLPKVLGVGGEGGKEVMAETISSVITRAWPSVGNARTKPELDRGFADISAVMRDLDDASIDSETRINIMAGFGEDGGHSLANMWKMADKNQQAVAAKAAEMATQLASQIATKRAKDPSYSASPNEEKVEEFVKALRERFPPGEKETPSAMKKALEPSSSPTV